MADAVTREAGGLLGRLRDPDGGFDRTSTATDAPSGLVRFAIRVHQSNELFQRNEMAALATNNTIKSRSDMPASPRYYVIDRPRESAQLGDCVRVR